MWWFSRPNFRMVGRRVLRKAPPALRRRLVSISATSKAILERFWVLPLVLLVPSLIVFFQPSLPAFGMTEDVSSIRTFLSAVAGTLAAIIGIVVAVSLVALELLCPTYEGHAFRELFARTSLRNLILLYLATIAVALFTLTRIGAYETEVVLALSNCVGILTLVSLTVLYPSLRRTLNASGPDRSRLKALANELSLANLLDVQRSVRLPFVHQLDRLDDHPLFILRTVAVRSIRDGDRKTAVAAISFVCSGFLKVIDRLGGETTTPGHRDVIRALLYYLRPVAAEALKQRDEASLQALASVYNHVQTFVASRGLPWHQLIELNSWFGDLAARGAEVGLDSFSVTAQRSIKEALVSHLEQNVPSEDEIWSLHLWEVVDDEDVDHEKANHWHNIRGQYLNMLSNSITSATKGGHAEIVSSNLMAFSWIINRVTSIESLGQKQKSDLIGWTNFWLQKTSLDAAETFGRLPGGILALFAALPISKALKNDEPWAKSHLLHLCQLHHELAKRQISSPASMNNLGAIGRGCIREIEEEERFAEATLLVAETLEKMGNAFSTFDSAEATSLLEGVQEQLESLQRWFDSSGVTHDHVEAKIVQMIGRIDERVGERGGSDQGLEWPTLPDGVR